jgi:hypothetical protein
MFGSGARLKGTITPSFFAPSLALSRYACGYYGVGHTNRRHPGEMRGTVIGREGRFRFPSERR